MPHHLLSQKPEDTALLTAVKRLASEYSREDVWRAIGEISCESIQETWAKKRNVFPSRGHACAMRTLGGKCKSASGLSAECACRPPGADHPSLWNYMGKPVVYVFHPYGLPTETVGELIAYCLQWKLRFEVDAYSSWHFPGRTLFVAVAHEKSLYWSLPLRKNP